MFPMLHFFTQDAHHGLNSPTKELWITSDTSPTTFYLKQVQMAQVLNLNIPLLIFLSIGPIFIFVVVELWLKIIK